MHSSSSVSKRLILVPILVVVATQLLFLRSVSSLNLTNAYLQHKCLVNQGKYKPGSDYEKALIDIIQGFSDKPKDSYGFRTGFGVTAYGKEPDIVAITFQCRIDSRGPKCASCIVTASSELLRKKCPKDKGALIWYDQCLVEFSSFDTTGQINYDDNFCLTSAKNLSNDVINFFDRVAFLSNLTKLAVTKIDKKIEGVKKPVLYSAGERRFGRNNLYGMVQCSADLSGRGCEECISYYLTHFQECWKPKQGVRVLSRSCSYRYELYPFISAKSPYYTKFLK
ncbi:PREDICTED: cysteine-rich repeat secretory protein 18-like [Camelina sativa]|uniref:Cysteine-rich repeat secretory protein 18-like n=1 Tax=Camelina sativa TaxID=90675 RepID=A0ABM0W6P5_CAMSA|nr:PREDICTED: cysteine-rich repeat secretory protein 18-like [Camelina sativa]